MFTYFSWWYLEEPAYIWRATRITTKKIFWAFSVPLLLRTLFDPWKRDQVYVENAALDTRFRIWLENLISRAVGFVVRLLTIFVGLLFTLITLIIFVIINLLWFLMPLIIIYLIVFGIGKILHG